MSHGSLHIIQQAKIVTSHFEWPCFSFRPVLSSMLWWFIKPGAGYIYIYINIQLHIFSICFEWSTHIISPIAWTTRSMALHVELKKVYAWARREGSCMWHLENVATAAVPQHVFSMASARKPIESRNRQRRPQNKTWIVSISNDTTRSSEWYPTLFLLKN